MRRMRRLLLIASLVLLAACSDDAGDSLGDNPTKQECLDVMRTVLQRLEVPDGVDPSDGLDDEERAKTDAALGKIGDDVGLDISDDNHPCNAATDSLTDEEVADLAQGVDPDVLELLGAQAQQEFQNTGTAIN
jgi:hypothetical protein